MYNRIIISSPPLCVLSFSHNYRDISQIFQLSSLMVAFAISSAFIPDRFLWSILRLTNLVLHLVSGICHIWYLASGRKNLLEKKFQFLSVFAISIQYSTVCPKIVGKRYIFVYISYTNGNFDVLLLFWHSLQSYLFNNITKLLFYCHITCILALQRSILSSNCKVHIWTYGRHIWIYSFDFFHIYQRLDINRDISEH